MKKEFNLRLKGRSIAFIDWANIYAQQKKHGWDIDIEKLEEYLFSFEQIKKVQFFHGTDQKNEKSKQFIKKLQENSQFEVFTKDVKYQKININNNEYKKEINNLQMLVKKIYEVLEMIIIETRLFRESVAKAIASDKSKNSNEIELAQELLDNFLDQIKKVESSFQKKIPIRKCDFDTEISGEMVVNSEKYKNFLLFSGDGDFKYAIEKIIQNNPKARIYVFSNPDSLGQEIWELEKRYIQVNRIQIKHIKKCLIRMNE